jgi:hypothetical protein
VAKAWGAPHLCGTHLSTPRPQCMRRIERSARATLHSKCVSVQRQHAVDIHKSISKALVPQIKRRSLKHHKERVAFGCPFVVLCCRRSFDFRFMLHCQEATDRVDQRRGAENFSLAIALLRTRPPFDPLQESGKSSGNKTTDHDRYDRNPLGRNGKMPHGRSIGTVHNVAARNVRAVPVGLARKVGLIDEVPDVQALFRAAPAEPRGLLSKYEALQ